MKYNFKRIASVLTGAVMLSSTIAIAAAANFPAPFVQNGAADVAVVYGSAVAPASTDIVKAQAISTKIAQLQTVEATSATPSTTTTVTGEGDSMVLEGSTLLHLGSALSTAFSKTVTDDSDMLPTLLASGKYTDDQGDDFDYDQEIEVNTALQPLQFSDTDVMDGDPVIGIQIPSGTYVLNYTFDFADEPTFDSEMESTNINVMGKEYYILDANNNTKTLTLLDSATTVTVPEGSTKEVTVNGKTYTISVTSIVDDTNDKVKFTVNGKSTSSALAAGGTLKISEGVYAAVKDVNYRSKESQVSDAEISIGTGKLVLDDGNEVESNDDVINGLYAYIDSADTIDSFTLKWVTENDEVITANSSISMPGFNTVKLSSTGMDYPEMETTEITTDGKAFVIETTVKDGEVSVPFLAINDTNMLGIIGKEYTKQLKTTNNTAISYDDDTDDMFVATYISVDDAESYVLRATSFSQDTSDRNTTTIQKMVDNSWEDVKTVKDADTVRLGNIELQVSTIEKNQKTATITAISSTTYFDKLVTEEGLKIQLPFASAVAASTSGAINTTANVTLASTTYNLQFSEENKDDAIGSGSKFNMTLGQTTDNDATVSSIVGVSTPYEVGESNLYVSQVYGELASTVEHDRDPTQKTAKVIYHGAESSFKLLLTAPSVSVSNSGDDDAVDLSKAYLVTDSQVSTVANKNLIVVGGSCINTVAAKLLGSNTPLCGAEFTAKTNVGAGQYLIKTYESPYNASKIATLVAGYEAQETQNAVDYLLSSTNAVDTTKGATYLTGVKQTVSTTA